MRVLWPMRLKHFLNPLKGEQIWSSKLFLSVLTLKIVASFLFASFFMKEFFTPFINWFVLSGFRNPWEFFYAQGMTRMFPYPPLMLGLMALARAIFSPFLPSDWQVVTSLHLFVMRIPLLICDLYLLYQLLRFWPTQPRRVLLLYWCSPIVFFINYVHGQLDIIPTTIFFAAVQSLLQARYGLAFVLYALAAATKIHVLIALPFLLVFLYKKKLGLDQITSLLFRFSAVWGLLVLPYIGSEAFRQMVFNTPEHQDLFDFVISLGPSLRLIVCPTVLMLVLLKFTSYKKLNQEILLMFLGIIFACPVLLAQPAPGRFIWSFPFLCYFYLGNKEYSRIPFILFNTIYMIYFLVFPLEEEPLFLVKYFSESFPLEGTALSVLMASMGFIAFWMYSIGVRRNEELRRKETPLMIGIAGDSGTGKHTLLQVLRNVVGKSNSIAIFGDDFHKWERGNENWRVYTPLNPFANRLHDSWDLAIALKEEKPAELVHYDHATGKFTNPVVVEPNKFIFFVGLHPYYLKQMRDLFQIKIFMEAEKDLREFWKVRRDVLRRGYQPAEVLRQIATREQDESIYIEPQKQFSDLTIQYATEAPIDPVHFSTIPRTPLITTYTLDNSVNLETLVSNLSNIQTLTIEHTSTVRTQELIVRGTISARQVMGVAYQLGLNFDELSVSTRGWLKDHNGITQLVFLLVYNQKARA